jgi:type II restriction enzyme
MSTLEEAKDILRQFRFPKAQTNDISGRTLLALAQQTADTKWADATNPRLGVRAMLDWMREHLDYPIAENSRESVRRFVLHQFVDAGFCLYNDDDPARATNSSKNNYRLTSKALSVIQRYGTDKWTPALEAYLAVAPGLADRYKQARDLHRIPITLPGGAEISIKAGGQNVLIKSMVDDFCSRFIQGGKVIYIGDADSKLGTFDEKLLASLGVEVNHHGKLPDLVVYQPKTNWLFLMEACSTHGPVDNIRISELRELFADSTAGLVFVSCFPDRATMRRFLPDLAWETEAWVADNPSHMIHFNGSKFLGPYHASEG